jgi:hypothetical protein
MRSMLILLSVFMALSLNAEKIGNVEYTLPKDSPEWKVANTLEGKEPANGTTIIYAPGDVTLEEAQETFGVVKVDLASGEIDKDSIKKMYEMQFPNLTAKVTVLEKDENSLTYEWTLSEGTKEVVHGWTRVFTSPDQTVLLTYQTEKMDDVEKARPLWVKVLREAKKTAKDVANEAKQVAKDVKVDAKEAAKDVKVEAEKAKNDVETEVELLK